MSGPSSLSQYLKRKYGITNIRPFRPPNRLGFCYFLGSMGSIRKPVFIKTDGLLGQAAKREASLIKMLEQHTKNEYFPHLIAYESVGKLSFVITDLIPGVSLDMFLSQKKTLDNTLKHLLLSQVESILYILHKTKVVHRDIRPSNLLVWRRKGNQRTKVALIDFSYAVRLEPNKLEELSFLRDKPYILKSLGGDFKPTKLTWDDAYSLCKIARMIDSKCPSHFPTIWSKLKSSIGKITYTHSPDL